MIARSSPDRQRALDAVKLTVRPPERFPHSFVRMLRRAPSRAPLWCRLVHIGLAGDTRAGVEAYRSLVRWKARTFPGEVGKRG